MPLVNATEEDRQFMQRALELAQESFVKGSIPVGSVMVRNGIATATGRNRSQETNDATSHGEIDCIRNAGLMDDYSGVTLYSTLSPCMMCSGAMLFLGIPHIVIGDRENYPGDIDFLLQRGLDVTLIDDPGCIELMRRFIHERPDLWQRTVSGETTS